LVAVHGELRLDINVNTASPEALIALPGIGETLADLIIQARPFTTIEELLSIPGIGSRTLERLKEQGLAVGDLPHQKHLTAVPGFTAKASLYSTSQRYKAMKRYGWYWLPQRRKTWDL
jgi:competence ComEA-like helix-hairpin-helix protein